MKYECEPHSVLIFLKQLYISCGEQWIDPQWTTAQHKKRLQCNNLTSDIMAMRAYCVMRNPKSEHITFYALLKRLYIMTAS